jgi:hypothetical protein
MKIRVYKRLAFQISIAILFLLLIPIIGLLSGQFRSLSTPKPTPTMGIFVDPLFKEFYATLGGQNLLGLPLTNLFERDGQRCQFTEAVLMCFDPGATETARRFHLSPLGRQLDVHEDAPLVSDQSGNRILADGFSLYDEFAPVYDRLYGALYTGRPLTQVRVNQANQRYEQFFENVGFYRNFDDPPDQVHLLPYGSYLCGPDCSRRLDEYWMIQQSGLISQPFEMSVQRLGWSSLGEPLAQPYKTADGMVEQVYDNVLLFAPEYDLSQVRLRPLVRILDFVQPEALVEKKVHDQLVFYAVKNGLGHNVPLFFDYFIANHGGRDLSGDPLTEMFVLEPERLYRQCFENYCLDYNALAPEQTRVHMVPLGLEYIRMTDPVQVLRRAFSSDTVQLSIEEAHPQLGKDEIQKVIIHVYHRKNGNPMYLAEGSLTLTYPNRPSESIHFAPTDSSGRSVIEFSVPQDLANMSVVEYRVCLNLPAEPRICSTESFLYHNR